MQVRGVLESKQISSPHMSRTEALGTPGFCGKPVHSLWWDYGSPGTLALEILLLTSGSLPSPLQTDPPVLSESELHGTFPLTSD